MTLSPREIMQQLAGLYGMPVHTPHGDAVAELALTILSQNTSDTNSGRAFTRLLRRFSSWDEVAAAPLDEVVEAIAAGGLAQQKAPRIQASLRAIAERADGWNLNFLQDMDLEEARAWLRSLPGVGPKTAQKMRRPSSTRQNFWILITRPLTAASASAASGPRSGSPWS